MENKLEEKQALYASIAAFYDSDDDAVDEGLQSSKKALKGKASKSNSNADISLKRDHRKSSPRSLQDVPRALSHSTSAASALTPLTRSSLSGNRKDTPHGRQALGQAEKSHLALKTRHIFSGALPPSSDIPQVTSKRKRQSEINVMPEDQQMFQGLCFYFFPNSEKDPARYMRITRAMQFGALWRRDWDDRITHIVVDKDMDYAKLLKFLKLDKLPEEMTLVDESWPSGCLAHHTILDPKQPQFRVRGAPAETTRPQPAQNPTSSADSNTSLKLKPAGKDDKARRSETPGEEHTSPPSSHPSYNVLRELTHPAAEASERIPSTDDLEAAISQARVLQAIPLDDDEAESRPSSSGGLVLPHDAEGSQCHRKVQTWEGKFQCMQKHTGDNEKNLNSATIAILQQMAKYHNQVGDVWRTRAYRQAIATLRNHPTKVSTKEEAQSLRDIGDRLATKIEEIAFTNRLRRLENARAEPTDHVLQTFMGVYGAGFVQASQWVRQGYTTLDELLEKADLSDNQRIGVEHFEDFRTRIPRAEVQQYGAIVTRELRKIDPAFEIIIGGSYRRGAASSGDIDCIITRPETGIEHLRSVVMNQLVPKLFKQRFLTAGLAVTSREDGSKWHGACCLPGSKTWRRIDFLFVPSAELGAALIYFTGNDIFNRSLRLLASTKGMRLNQRGLYKDVMGGKAREKLSEGTLVEGEDEKRIFEVLGVPWRPPEHRIP